MITMNVKGMRWVGNMYQKFENMFLEAEDMMYEDTVKYIENQMQAVGESVKKFYSDVVDDLLPSDEEIDVEFPLDKLVDARFGKKPFQVYKERRVKADPNPSTEDSWNEHVDNDASFPASYYRTSKSYASTSLRNSVKESNFSSPSRRYVRRMDVKSNLGIDENQVNKKAAATDTCRTSHCCETSNENQNQYNGISVSKSDSTEARRIPKWYDGTMDVKSNLGIDENQVNKKVNATKIINETTLAETDTCRTSQSCEISNENLNQNNGISVSEPASTEVTMLASETDCSNDIEKASSKQLPNVQELGKSAEEKQIHASSSSFCVSFAEPVEQDHTTMQEDNLKLEEACVMVNIDEIQLPPKASGNVNTNKKKKQQVFSLSKKSARKQEYKDLAAWHLKSEKVMEDCMENSDPTSPQDQKKILLSSSMCEPDWELL